jgi:hypothetical protein
MECEVAPSFLHLTESPTEIVTSIGSKKWSLAITSTSAAPAVAGANIRNRPVIDGYSERRRSKRTFNSVTRVEPDETDIYQRCKSIAKIEMGALISGEEENSMDQFQFPQDFAYSNSHYNVSTERFSSFHRFRRFMATSILKH